MADIQWREPDVFACGDSLIFQRSLPDFPATKGWSLHYTLTLLTPTGGEQKIAFDSQAQNDLHLINVASFAEDLNAGDYILAGFAVNNGPPAERKQIYYGELTLLPDLAAGTVTAPLTTHAQRMITILEGQMEELASHVLQETDVQRSRFVWAKRHEVLGLLNFYRERRLYELKVQAVANGQGNPNRIVPVFDCG